MAPNFDNGVTLKQLEMGSKGSVMTFRENDSQSSDTGKQQWNEAHYDGKPGSWCPVIPIHWHKYHDEYHHVLKGKISYTVDGVTRDYTPEDGELFLPRLSRHGFHFYPGVETLLRERTNPNDVGKQSFFEDLLEDGEPNFATAMRSGYNGDCYPSLPGHISVLEVAFVNVVGGFLNWWKPVKRASD